jgi:hypothetical protein
MLFIDQRTKTYICTVSNDKGVFYLENERIKGTYNSRMQ